MGMADILSADRIVVVATNLDDGENGHDVYHSKVFAAQKAIETLDVSASAVRMHDEKNFTFIFEKAVASGVGTEADILENRLQGIEILEVNDNEVKYMNLEEDPPVFKVLVQANRAPLDIEVQLWTNMRERTWNNPDGDENWHEATMHFKRITRDGYLYERKLNPREAGTYEFTVRIAPKLRAVQSQWKWLGDNKEIIVKEGSPSGARLSENETSTPGNGKPETSTTRKLNTVLVIDDESIILNTMSVFFEAALGFSKENIFLEQNAEKAQALVEQKSQDFDLLLIDLNLNSDVNGLEIARRARSLNDDVVIVVMSGLITQQVRDAKEEGLIDAVWKKPMYPNKMESSIKILRQIPPGPRTPSGARLTSDTSLADEPALQAIPNFAGKLIKTQRAHFTRERILGARVAIEIKPNQSTILRFSRRGDGQVMVHLLGQAIAVPFKVVEDHLNGKDVVTVSISDLLLLVVRENQEHIQSPSKYSTQVPVVVELHVNDLIGTPDLTGARLANLVAEVNLLEPDVAVLVRGDRDLVKEILDELTSKGRVFADETELPDRFQDATFVYVMNPETREALGADIAPQSLFLIIESLEDKSEASSVVNLRPVFKMVQAMRSLGEISTDSENIHALHDFFKRYAHPDISLEAFIKLISGDIAMAMKYPIPAIIKVSIHDALRLYRLMTRMAEQAA